LDNVQHVDVGRVQFLNNAPARATPSSTSTAKQTRRMVTLGPITRQSLAPSLYLHNLRVRADKVLSHTVRVFTVWRQGDGGRLGSGGRTRCAQWMATLGSVGRSRTKSTRCSSGRRRHTYALAAAGGAGGCRRASTQREEVRLNRGRAAG